MSNRNLKVVSLNVNGIANAVKRKIIFNNLRDQKADIYLIQETHSSEDQSRLWTNEWGGKAFYSHGSSGSRGVAILFNRHTDFQVLSEIRDNEGRFLGMDIQIGEQELSLGSVYAPTQDKQRQQLQFFEELEDSLAQLQGLNLILGGDFNVILDPKIDKNQVGGGHSQSDPGRNALKSLLDERNMVDVWRMRNPLKRAYKFRRGAYSSRLDFFLTSPFLTEISDKTEIKFLTCSDHSLISIQLNFNSNVERGPGFWRLDTELLKDSTFVMGMKEFLDVWIPPQELSSPIQVWEWLKHGIRNFTRQFQKTKKSEEKKRLQSLETDLLGYVERRDSGEPDLDIPIESISRQIRELEENKARKIIFRSRANWSLYGEKLSKFFLNLQKRKTRESLLASVISEEGVTITDH